MKKKPYLPDSDAGKRAWLTNFNSKLATYATLLGITPAQLLFVAQATALFVWALDSIVAIDAAKQSFVNFKNLLRNGQSDTPLDAAPTLPTLPATPALTQSGIFTVLRLLVRSIKANAKYNTAIGTDLGIIGDESNVDIDTLKPVFTVEPLASGNNIIWSKIVADGVRIEVDRAGGRNFDFLAHDTQPNYLDTYPKPAPGTSALWAYRMVYVIDDEVVGQWSEAVEIAVAG